MLDGFTRLSKFSLKIVPCIQGELIVNRYPARVCYLPDIPAVLVFVEFDGEGSPNCTNSTEMLWNVDASVRNDSVVPNVDRVCSIWSIGDGFLDLLCGYSVHGIIP